MGSASLRKGLLLGSLKEKIPIRIRRRKEPNIPSRKLKVIKHVLEITHSSSQRLLSLGCSAKEQRVPQQQLLASSQCEKERMRKPNSSAVSQATCCTKLGFPPTGHLLCKMARSGTTKIKEKRGQISHREGEKKHPNRTPEKAERESLIGVEGGTGPQMGGAGPRLGGSMEGGILGTHPAGPVSVLQLIQMAGRGLAAIVWGEHVLSAAVGLQGFDGVDILRQLRLAPH